MAVDYISQITELSRNNHKLSVSDDCADYPQFIQSKDTWKGYVLGTLSHIPILKSLKCVQDFVAQEKNNNVRVLSLFLHALSNRYGAKHFKHKQGIINIHIDNKLDFSCHKRLDKRTIHQVVDKLDRIYGMGEAKYFERAAVIRTWPTTLRCLVQSDYIGHVALTAKNGVGNEKRYISWAPSKGNRVTSIGHRVPARSAPNYSCDKKRKVTKDTTYLKRAEKVYLPFFGVNTSLEEAPITRMFGLSESHFIAKNDDLLGRISNNYYTLFSKTNNCAGVGLVVLKAAGADIFVKQPKLWLFATPNFVRNYSEKLVAEIDRLNDKADHLLAEYQDKGFSLDVSLSEALDAYTEMHHDPLLVSIKQNDDPLSRLKQARDLTVMLDQQSEPDMKQLALLCGLKNELVALSSKN